MATILMSTRKQISFYFLFLICSTLFGQARSISGQIIDNRGQPVPFATIGIKGTSQGTVADQDGKFSIGGIKNGNYVLLISSAGFEAKELPIKINGRTNLGKIQVNSSTSELDEVVVSGTALSTIIERKGFSVEAIETKEIKSQSIDLNKVLDRSAGVRVRRSGGMGSDFTYSLDGMSGKSIKFFVDGIPMDYFGSSYSINNLPISLINRIDIYKGVVPVHLGSDALGGAINLVTNQNVRNFLEVSYSYGSFNTHQTDIQGQWRDETSGFTTRLSTFYNYSDNNYKVWGRSVFYADESTGFRPVEFTKENPAERFNDDFRTVSAKLDLGYTDKPWADQFFVGVLVSDLERGIQTGQTMAYVYGEARYDERFIMPNVTYKKEDFLVSNLSINLFTSYAFKEGVNVDTTRNNYDWRNTIINQDADGGEIGAQRSLFTLNEDAFVSRLNATYSLNGKHKLGINYVLKDVTRKGSDEFAAWWRIPFTEPQSLTTHFGGLSLESELIQNKLNTNIFLKYYGYTASLNEDVLISIEGEQQTIAREVINDQNFIGGGIATSFKVSQAIQAKLSVEQAIRMPDVDEALGNGLTVINAPGIKPEQSFNINLGLALGKYTIGGDHSIKIALNTFYRDTKDQLLFTVLETDGTGQFQNINKTLGKGVEIDISHQYQETIEFTANATYLDIRNNQEFDETANQPNIVYQDRLRNTPYLMANSGLRWKPRDLIQKGGQFLVYYQLGYVHEYFLKWPSLGSRDQKEVIPTQLVHDIGVGYTFPNEKLSLAIDVSNIANEQVYDNFLLQKPGRAVFGKIRYQIRN